MLHAYRCGTNKLVAVTPEAASDATSEAAPPTDQKIIWYDLKRPTPEEVDLVAKATGLTLPTEPDIVEIENSSRLSIDEDVLTMTMPIAVRTEHGLIRSDCGFVLSADRLVTIRFVDSQLFDAFTKHPHDTGKSESQSAFVFVALLEAIVDRQADSLERLRGELDKFSHDVFHHSGSVKVRRERKEEENLRKMLVTVGRVYDNVSFLRDSQLGVGRIAVFVRGTATWLPKPVDTRLQALQADIDSLNEFSVHLTDKVQFLLDATLGLINIEQSTLMKVFTVAAVIGIPPTLIAGIYGMNFKNMPELSWQHGYAFGWALIILSAVMPMVWFRVKGWL